MESVGVAGKGLSCEASVLWEPTKPVVWQERNVLFGLMSLDKYGRSV